MKARIALALGVLVLSVSAYAPPARADDPRFGPNDIRTLFVVAKNIDRNEVQYGIRLDGNCVPVGDEPMYAYWRQFERGPDVVEDLNFMDKTVYGIHDQRVVKRAPDESKVVMSIKATPQRGVAIILHKRDGKCVADTVAIINSAPAQLERVFVHVAGFLSVDWVEISGRLNGKPTVERVKH